MNRTKVIAVICSAVFAVLLSGCGGGNSGHASIGGTVTGLAAGTTVSLANNSGAPIIVSGAGSTAVGFTFPGTIASAAGYNVVVSAQPTAPGTTNVNQTCVVTSGSGVIDYSGNNVSNVTVSCSSNATIGVSVSKLNAGNVVSFNLILQKNPNNIETIPVTGVAGTTVTANFTTMLTLGDVYSVSVNTQPNNNSTPIQVCIADSPSSASGGVVGSLPLQPIVISFTCR